MHRRFFSVLSGAVNRGAASHGRSAGGHNRLHYNDNADHKQYEKIVEERVIKETIPNKGKLANTGGMSLTGAAFLGLASVGLGVSILRFAVRREP